MGQYVARRGGLLAVPGGLMAVSWRSAWRSHWGALLVTFDNVGFGAGWHVAECCTRRKQIVVFCNVRPLVVARNVGSDL